MWMGDRGSEQGYPYPTRALCLAECVTPVTAHSPSCGKSLPGTHTKMQKDEDSEDFYV